MNTLNDQDSMIAHSNSPADAGHTACGCGPDCQCGADCNCQRDAKCSPACECTGE